ncbi:response regulator [Aneurinibacillus migulanus]|uniref:response regulator transcription factor n=1 Tax=Aneurinibacillus migulanus TaxID=47500 RepID=UPI002E24D087|nr:helix-turn-helix domain-containing protein [Aneurinibacillus migulanus]MED4727647.1 response regulator [Aneurinibacillus migulanus]
MNLLIVDDEPLEREVLARIISKGGFTQARCFEAQNGADAVEVARRQTIDLAILDIKMPVMDGLTAAERIRAEQPNCRLIFLTAYEEERFADMGMHEFGIERYLLKPVHPQEIARTLREFLPSPKNGTSLDAEETHPVFKIKSYIKRHLAEELTLESLAELVHLHPQYVSRLFKQKAGLTLTDYIIQIRLEKARRLLAETELSMAQIGELCGFLDPNYFSRLFRKHEGETPTKYRKRRKAMPNLPPYQFQHSLF